MDDLIKLILWRLQVLNVFKSLRSSQIDDVTLPTF